MSQISINPFANIPGAPGAIPTIFRTTAGDAIPALNILTLTNGNNFTFTAAGSAITGAITGTTNHRIQIGNASASISSMADPTTGQIVMGVNATDPAWSTTTYPATTVKGDVLIASANNVIGVVNDVVNAGYVLTTNVGAAPSFQAPANMGFQVFSGRATWGGAGNYFDDTVLGDFTISRPGTGYILGVPVSWTAPQTVSGMTAGNTYFIYIDNTGTIGKSSSRSNALYENNVVLFECLRDSTSPTNNQITVKEDHPYGLPVETSNYLHDVVGTVIENTNNGANITLNGTQGIQINGADELEDHGLTTTISDSGGVAVTWHKMYTNGAGKWVQQNNTNTFTGFYNNAGTATALTAGRFGVYTLYVSKDTLTSSTPTYYAVLDTSQYTSQNLATTAIANGTTAKMSGELAALELAQLGYIVYRQSTAAIVVVTISKSTLKQTLSTAGTNQASLVNTNTTNFNGILSAADTNVQAALDTIDDWGANTTDHALLIGNGNGLPVGVIAVGANGECLMGSTGADCGWTSSPQFGGSITALNDITSTAGSISSLSGSVISKDATNSATGPSMYFQKSRIAAAITSGDALGMLRFTGYDGTGFISGARIRSVNSGTVATNRIAGSLVFETHPDSVIALPSEPLTRMTIASTGEVTISAPDSGVALTIVAGGETITSGDFTATLGNINIVSSTKSLVLPANSTSQIKCGTTTWFRNNGGTTPGAEYANLFWGYNAGNAAAGANAYLNAGYGSRCFESLTGAQENFAMGYRSLGALTGTANSGYRNVAIGNYSLYRLVGGDNVGDHGAYNTCLGYNTGGNYTGNEYSNILINYFGVAGQNNRLQIGTSTGNTVGVGILNEAYICGIYGRTPIGTINVSLIGSNNQLGSTSLLTPALGGRDTVVNCTTSNTVAMSTNTRYIATSTDGATLVVFTLPGTFVVGDTLEIVGVSSGLWELDQNAANTIFHDNAGTTPGITGKVTVTAGHQYTSITLRAITTANWVITSVAGAITLA